MCCVFLLVFPLLLFSLFSSSSCLPTLWAQHYHCGVLLLHMLLRFTRYCMRLEPPICTLFHTRARIVFTQCHVCTFIFIFVCFVRFTFNFFETFLFIVNNSKIVYNIFHGNKKDCAPFSRPCVELVQKQKTSN